MENKVKPEGKTVEKQMEKPSTNTSEKTIFAALSVAQVGLDKKAENVRVLDLRGMSTYTDFLVILTATSERQVSAVADAADDALRACGYRALGVEGTSSSSWILIDAEDLVVHVFTPEARQFYDLDTLWVDAKTIAIPAVPAQPNA